MWFIAINRSAFCWSCNVKVLGFVLDLGSCFLAVDLLVVNAGIGDVLVGRVI